MKTFWRVVCMCLALGSLSAVPPPVKGSPLSMTGARVIKGAGDYVFEFNLPEHWGLGEEAALPDGTGHFLLFPEKGGQGVQIQVKSFTTEVLAKQAFDKDKAQYKTVKKLADGFEVELPKAWFSCRLAGKQVIHTWYSLAKKKKHHPANWKKVKSCLHVSCLAQYPIPIVEAVPAGALCHHPERKFQVLFKASPGTTCRANRSAQRSHYLEIARPTSSALMYIKWDVNPSEKELHVHANTMMKDLRQSDPKQKFSDPVRSDADAVIIGGYPYHVVSIACGGLLIGFAVKTEGDILAEMVHYMTQLSLEKNTLRPILQ
jgi:hypothetical protein